MSQYRTLGLRRLKARFAKMEHAAKRRQTSKFDSEFALALGVIRRTWPGELGAVHRKLREIAVSVPPARE